MTIQMPLQEINGTNWAGFMTANLTAPYPGTGMGYHMYEVKYYPSAEYENPRAAPAAVSVVRRRPLLRHATDNHHPRARIITAVVISVIQ